MADFLKLANGHLAFQLYIKLHPAERTKEVYETVFNGDERVQILLSSESPSTFDLLSRAHLHLSISSTCHYEALGLGAPTVILPFPTHEDILPLHKAGYAFLAQTPQALLDIALEWQHLSISPEVGSFYFQTNTLANMKKELGL
jgi:UDP-N-acetylglucosamine 2-epimerase